MRTTHRTNLRQYCQLQHWFICLSACHIFQKRDFNIVSKLVTLLKEYHNLSITSVRRSLVRQIKKAVIRKQFLIYVLICSILKIQLMQMMFQLLWNIMSLSRKKKSKSSKMLKEILFLSVFKMKLTDIFLKNLFDLLF